jgi:serine/threonine protein kinase
MSTKDYGCFFCEGKSTEENGICDKCGRKINVEEELKKKQFGDYKPIEKLGRGYLGWTLHATNTLGRDFAIKIIPKHRFSDDIKKLTNEAEAFIKCTRDYHRHIAQFFHLFETNIKVMEQSIPVIVLVFDYIPKANPLRKLINSSELLSRTDVLSLLSGIASGLSRMHSCGLWHDDLHDDNILVREVQHDENLNDKYEIKLIDFGSAKPRNTNEPEPDNGSDYFYLSKHILGLVSLFEKGQLQNKGITPEDRAFAQYLKLLASRISDTNVSRRDITPQQVVEELKASSLTSMFQNRFPSFEEMLQESKVSIRDPLEKPNALRLLPQDIPLLFTDELKWRGYLQTSETIIITGPRGCGKTMLLKYLSISCQARPLAKKEKTREEVWKRLQNLDHISFFVSCQELKTPFIRSSFEKLKKDNDSLAADFSREYINIFFAVEVCRVMLWLKNEGLAPINGEDLDSLSILLFNLLNNNKQIPTGSSNLSVVAEDLERRCVELSNLNDPLGYQSSNLCSDMVLVQIANVLKGIPCFRGKRIRFLLDDYSVSVIRKSSQIAYNSIVFKISPLTSIILSSEGDGPILTDQLSRQYKEGREFSKVNLGQTYFSVDDDVSQKFIESILQMRFEETGKGSLQQLKYILGEHSHEKNYGSYILEQGRAGDSRFYGFSLLCKLCSGDVSFIIELFKNIVGSDWSTARKPIPPAEQDEKTKYFARRQLTNLRSTPVYGQMLYITANNIGNLVKAYLMSSKDTKSPDERLRIEIEGYGELSSVAQGLHEALLRYSVLVKGSSGKDKSGRTTQQYYFRRLFAPCFPFSPLIGGCIPLNVEEYNRWLIDPNTIEKNINTVMDGIPNWNEGLGRFEGRLK